MIIFNHRIIIAIIIYVSLFVAAFFFLIRPMMKNVDAQIGQLTNRYSEYRSTKDKIARLSKLNDSLGEVDKAKKLLAFALPADVDQDRLTLTLEKLVSDTNLNLTSLTINTTKPAAVAAASSQSAPSSNKTPVIATPNTIQAAIDVSGTYNNIKSLLTSIEKLDRILAITSTTLTSQISDKTPDTIAATITVTGYTVGAKR